MSNESMNAGQSCEICDTNSKCICYFDVTVSKASNKVTHPLKKDQESETIELNEYNYRWKQEIGSAHTISILANSDGKRNFSFFLQPKECISEPAVSNCPIAIIYNNAEKDEIAINKGIIYREQKLDLELEGFNYGKWIKELTESEFNKTFIIPNIHRVQADSVNAWKTVAQKIELTSQVFLAFITDDFEKYIRYNSYDINIYECLSDGGHTNTIQIDQTEEAQNEQESSEDNIADENIEDTPKSIKKAFGKGYHSHTLTVNVYPAVSFLIFAEVTIDIISMLKRGVKKGSQVGLSKLKDSLIEVDDPYEKEKMSPPKLDKSKGQANFKKQVKTFREHKANEERKEKEQNEKIDAQKAMNEQSTQNAINNQSLFDGKNEDGDYQYKIGYEVYVNNKTVDLLHFNPEDVKKDFFSFLSKLTPFGNYLEILFPILGAMQNDGSPKALAERYKKPRRMVQFSMINPTIRLEGGAAVAQENQGKLNFDTKLILKAAPLFGGRIDIDLLEVLVNALPFVAKKLVHYLLDIMSRAEKTYLDAQDFAKRHDFIFYAELRANLYIEPTFGIDFELNRNQENAFELDYRINEPTLGLTIGFDILFKAEIASESIGGVLKLHAKGKMELNLTFTDEKTIFHHGEIKIGGTIRASIQTKIFIWFESKFSYEGKTGYAIPPLSEEDSPYFVYNQQNKTNDHEMKTRWEEKEKEQEIHKKEFMDLKHNEYLQQYGHGRY